MSDPFKLPNFMINGNELVYLFDSHADALAGQQMIRDAVRRVSENNDTLAVFQALVAVRDELLDKNYIDALVVANAAIARAIARAKGAA